MEAGDKSAAVLDSVGGDSVIHGAVHYGLEQCGILVLCAVPVAARVTELHEKSIFSDGDIRHSQAGYAYIGLEVRP